MLTQALSETIKSLRTQNGISQEKMAYEAHISLRQFQRIEAGENVPTIENIFNIARVLGVHYTVLQDPAWEAFGKNNAEVK